jgi:hypothetical protein
MTTPTNEEQEMLELINRARYDPSGEFDELILNADSQTGISAGITGALRYFDVDMDLLLSQFNSYTTVPPLAWNSALSGSAEIHSQGMITYDTQSHNLPGEASLIDRARNAGYDNLQRIGENIYAYADDATFAHAGFYIDWGDTTTGIQQPAGHRNTILSENFTEVGIGAIEETNNNTQVGELVVTQHFGNRFDYEAQVVGVVIDDADGDRFYDAGEGLGGVTITAVSGNTSQSTVSWSSGGYQMELAAGDWTVTFSGGGLNGTIVRNFTIGSDNVKVDAVAADANNYPTDPVVRTGTGNSDTLTGGSGDDTLNGNGGADWINPYLGSDMVNGGPGNDMVSFSDHFQSVVINLSMNYAIVGPDTNTLNSIEHATGGVRGDHITGDSGDNRLRGLGDYDWFVGSNGDDTYEGGTGRDMIAYSSAASGVTIDFALGMGMGGQAQGDTYDSIERATGSGHNDLIIGGAGAEDFRGLGGSDWFVGSGGGKDRYDGGSGRDTVAYTASSEGIQASLFLGRGLTGDAEFDLYTEIENLTGSSHMDILTGDHDRNVLRGLGGNDVIYGNGGVDTITGGLGNDYIHGGSGWDRVIFSGDQDDYLIEDQGGNRYRVTDTQGNDGIDTLLWVEVLQFADGDVFL